MKLGILQCGRAPQPMVEQFGDYNELFIKLLGPSFDYDTYTVLDNVFPDSITAADGWLITGSRHGVYEDHAWIPPLEQFLRDAFEAKIPIAGICFGHQILAQALGGKVEKYSGGWSVGQVTYQLNDAYAKSSTGLSEDTKSTALNTVRINAFHQDQVIEPPANAITTGSTDFCKHAFLSYGDQAVTMQPHPEFGDGFCKELLDTRGREVLPLDVVETGLANFTESLSQPFIATQLQNFFRSHSVNSAEPADKV